ncbi:hypothetical protein [Povalibacter sp.]|uniref:hypothetical protein n=1 Tax=Povalibacter sp. TaxID=1962978 RepID=UPI002F3EA7E5
MAKQDSARPTYTSTAIKADVDKAVFLGNVVLDNMMSVLIAVGTEVWSVRRRMMVLEKLLEQKGVTADMIEAYMPSAEDAKQWQEDRDAFVRRTFSALANEGGLSFDAKRPD